MTILANILLGIAAFLYLVPLQIFLREPIQHSGQGAGGVIAFVFVTVPLWVTIFLAWCISLARGEFAWVGGGRVWQFLILLVALLAFTVVTSLAAMLRGDPHCPWALRPLMPWGIYVLPFFVLLATISQANPLLEVPAFVSRWTLAACGAIALASAVGMAVEWLVWQEKRSFEAAKAQTEFDDQNVRSIVAEVEAMDPIKDLGRLLGHSASNRFDAPRALATKKIQTHPNLQAELALRLTNEWALETLGYLELNDPPDAAALAIPVRTALEGLTPWMQRELAGSDRFWPETYCAETRIALAVADKFTRYGIDYLPAIRAWRAAFDCPNAQQSKLEAPRLIDTWLTSHAPADNRHAVGSRR